MHSTITTHDKRLTASFSPAPFTLDCFGKISLSTLTTYLIHTAELHAAANGFSVNTLQSKGYSWVLIRLAIEEWIEIDPTLPFSIQTWIGAISGVTTERCYEILQNNKPIGYACSIWSAIDLAQRSPMRMNIIFDQMDIISDKICPIEKPKKIRPFIGECIGLPFQVNYSQMDINNHLNSAKYVDKSLDVLPLGSALAKDIIVGRVVMNFNKEATRGEILQAMMVTSDNTDQNFRIAIVEKDSPSTPLFTMEYRPEKNNKLIFEVKSNV